MATHFSQTEFDQRREVAVAALKARGLAGILLFKQESMYYLTGYDTFGFCFFQCLWLGGDGRMTLLTRAPDLRQAQHTSIIDDIRIWVDEAGADPAGTLRDVVAGHGGAGKRIGVERDTQGLTAANWLKVEAAFRDFCTLEDASDLVSTLRLVKSADELAYVRRAAELADDALAKPSGCVRLAPSRAISSPPCRARSSAAAASIPATRSSSAQAPTRCSVGTRPDAAGWQNRTSSPSSSPVPTAATTRRSCAPSW